MMSAVAWSIEWQLLSLVCQPNLHVLNRLLHILTGLMAQASVPFGSFMIFWLPNKYRAPIEFGFIGKCPSTFCKIDLGSIETAEGVINIVEYILIVVSPIWFCGLSHPHIRIGLAE
jgi:hypothetical protein